MGAGRLISLMLLLQERGRVTAADLAKQLEVSERTVLRDIDELSGAGVPVFATRGPNGGFQLLDGYTTALSVPGGNGMLAGWPGRARVRITAEGRRLAALTGRLQPLRISRATEPDEHGRVEATFRVTSTEAAILDVLSLSPHVEVVGPRILRDEVSERIRLTALLYRVEREVED